MIEQQDQVHQTTIPLLETKMPTQFITKCKNFVPVQVQSISVRRSRGGSRWTTIPFLSYGTLTGLQYIPE